MRVTLIVLAVALAVAVQLAFAADEEKTTSAPANTYFGVDANDAQAVKEVVDQLNKDKFKELFGDVDTHEIDFTPNDAHFSAVEKLAEAFDSLMQMFRSVASSTTPPPSN